MFLSREQQIDKIVAILNENAENLQDILDCNGALEANRKNPVFGECVERASRTCGKSFSGSMVDAAFFEFQKAQSSD